MLKSYTDQQIIEAFRAGGSPRDSAWEYAFKTWKNGIISNIVRNGGTRDEAMDAIQDTCIHFENRVKQPGFIVERSLFAYFKYAVYRCWVNSRKANSNVFSELRDEELEKFSLEIDAQIVRGELARLLDETIGRLGNRCQSILSLAIGGFSMREIAEKMGFKGGEQVAKNEKRKCQERYENYLNENPVIKEQLKNLFHG